MTIDSVSGKHHDHDTEVDLTRRCRWYLADENGGVEAECCHCHGHAGPHHVLFGYVPGSVALGIAEGDPGTLVLADADWQPPTGNPWSPHFSG